MENEDVVLKKYKVLGEVFPCDEDGKTLETPLEIGSIQEVPQIVGEDWIKNGLAEEVVE